MPTTTTALRFLHFWTDPNSGVTYLPNQVVSLDTRIADQLVRAGLALVNGSTPPPPVPPDPYPQYTTPTEVSAIINTAAIGGDIQAEAVRDIIAAALVAGPRMAITYDDELDTLTIDTSATVNSSDTALRDRSTHTGSQTASTISDLVETVQDIVGAMMLGSGVVYDDAAGTITITGAGGGTLDSEAVQDIVGAMVVGSGVITATYNDSLNRLTITSAATVNSTDAQLRDRATHTGTQPSTTISDFATAVDARINNLVAGAPAALNTLDELAQAIGDDANFAATVTNALAAREPLLPPAGVVSRYLAGDKTFVNISAMPVIPTVVQTALNARVDVTTDQSIDGNKTFLLSPTVPDPVDDTDAAHKAYVDNAIDTAAPAGSYRVYVMDPNIYSDANLSAALNAAPAEAAVIAVKKA